MGFASETNSNPEMDNESILEFELDEATFETDLTSDDDIYEYDLSLPGNKIPKCQVVQPLKCGKFHIILGWSVTSKICFLCCSKSGIEG